MMAMTRLTGMNRQTRDRWVRHVNRSFEIIIALLMWFVIYPVMPENVPVQTLLVLVIGMFLMLEGIFKWSRYLDRHTPR